MIVRTPPPKRPRSETMLPESPSAAGSDRHMVIYEDSPLAAPLHESPQQQHSDHLLCTYQCRQMVKLEFLDALSSAEKQVCDYQSRFETMNENFSKVEAERKKFLDQFLYAEQDIAAAKGREQALQEQLLKEVNDFQEQFRKQIQSQSDLEVKQLLFLLYCQAITFYLLKSEGQPIRDHPVLARLVEIKSLLDKTKQLDGNLPSELEEFLNNNQGVEMVVKLGREITTLSSDSLTRD